MIELERRYKLPNDIFEKLFKEYNPKLVGEYKTLFFTSPTLDLQLRFRDGRVELVSKIEYEKAHKELTEVYKKSEVKVLLRTLALLKIDSGLYTYKKRSSVTIEGIAYVFDQYIEPRLNIVELEYETYSQESLKKKEKEILQIAKENYINDFEVPSKKELIHELAEISSFSLKSDTDILEVLGKLSI